MSADSRKGSSKGKFFFAAREFGSEKQKVNTGLSVSTGEYL